MPNFQIFSWLQATYLQKCFLLSERQCHFTFRVASLSTCAQYIQSYLIWHCQNYFIMLFFTSDKRNFTSWKLSILIANYYKGAENFRNKYRNNPASTALSIIAVWDVKHRALTTQLPIITQSVQLFYLARSLTAGLIQQ